MKPKIAPLRRRAPRRRSPFALLLALGLLLAAAPAALRFYVDLLWFDEVGFTRVLSTEIAARSALFVGVSLAAFALLFGSWRLAERRMRDRPVLLRDPTGKTREVSGFLLRITLPVAALAALVAGVAAGEGWMAALEAWRGVPFGVLDPVFGRDVGAYVFRLPVVAAALGGLELLLWIALLGTVAIYWSREAVGLTPEGRLAVERPASRQLSLLGAGLFAVAALRALFVHLPGILFSTRGPLVGASYTDLHAVRPGWYAVAVAAVAGAVVLVVDGRRGRLARGAAIAVGGYLLVSVVARGVYPAAVQRLVVDPTELTRETPSLANHVAMTRTAWGLDDVESHELSGAAEIDLADVRANAATIENVRIWDVEPLLQTFGQLQEIRTYYDFVSVDDDRYWIDGRYRQVLLSPRELNAASLPTRTFINEHLTFTHGMGLTLAPVNQATEQGLPVLFVQDLPPRSNLGPEITRPQIYFGELTDSYVFVGTRQREFDYPAGDENVFTAYEGRGGVSVGHLGRRALLAAWLGSSKVLLSGDITNESRVLIHRHIGMRARKALPFLVFDSDPYLVIREDGSLAWILDAYTTSRRFPYAARLSDGTSYMRNAVKVVVDAYHGSIDAYVTDPDDPLVRTLAAIFPGILQPLDAMPADLRAHLRYPGDLYRVQMGLYTIYHMDDPAEFYHREDQWQIPAMRRGDQEAPFMRRIIMKLPNEGEREEFIYMTPFTPRQKDNLTAWVVARSDGEHYGQLVEYRFPRQSLVFGPRQIVNRIDQDTEVSRQLSLWDQRGSTVIRGELMVIPIEESLVYVQPIFLRAEGGRIPEMKRVVVAYQDRVVMEETLEEGLSLIFGAAPGTIPPSTAPAGRPAAELGGERASEPTATGAAAPPNAELARQARAIYERALAAQRAGDWARYGEEIERLGEVLERMAGREEPPQ